MRLQLFSSRNSTLFLSWSSASVSLLAWGIVALLAWNITRRNAAGESIFIPVVALGALTVLAVLTAVCLRGLRACAPVTGGSQTTGLCYEEIVDTLTRTLAGRNGSGGNRISKTWGYARGLARHFGLSEPETQAIRLAIQLRDVGYLAIPDHILRKVEKLTPAESEKIRAHACAAADLLGHIHFTGPVIETIRAHHERWDGAGYPDCLRGEQIPLTARIFAVADCFAALGEDRPYRLAFRRDKAMQVLQEEAGKQFDPAIVRCLVDNLTEFEAEIPVAGAVETGHLVAMADRTGSDLVREAMDESAALIAMNSRIQIEPDPEKVLEILTGELRRIIPFDTSAFFRIDMDHHRATACYVAGIEAQRIRDCSIALQQGVTGLALARQAAQVNADPGADFVEMGVGTFNRFRNMLVFPMSHENHPFGALTLYSLHSKSFTGDHLRILETIAPALVEKIHDARLKNRLDDELAADSVTGLPGARALEILFEKETRRARRNNTPLTLMTMDIDGFRKFNDEYGYEEGDRLLREMAEVLSAEFRAGDILARLSGDEYVALIPRLSADPIIDLTVRIHRAPGASTFLTSAGLRAGIGLHIGQAVLGNDGETLAELICVAQQRKTNGATAAGVADGAADRKVLKFPGPRRKAAVPATL
ncbi:MAG: HD domain-containing phosphohydrolase [Blastocatellia bacterium]